MSAQFPNSGSSSGPSQVPASQPGKPPSGGSASLGLGNALGALVNNTFYGLQQKVAQAEALKDRVTAQIREYSPQNSGSTGAKPALEALQSLKTQYAALKTFKKVDPATQERIASLEREIEELEPVLMNKVNDPEGQFKDLQSLFEASEKEYVYYDQPNKTATTEKYDLLDALYIKLKNFQRGALPENLRTQAETLSYKVDLHLLITSSEMLRIGKIGDSLKHQLREWGGFDTLRRIEEGLPRSKFSSSSRQMPLNDIKESLIRLKEDFKVKEEEVKGYLINIAHLREKYATLVQKAGNRLEQKREELAPGLPSLTEFERSIGIAHGGVNERLKDLSEAVIRMDAIQTKINDLEKSDH